MSWFTGSVVSVREEFVLAVLSRRKSFTEYCRCFSIARSTGYKWLNRFRKEGRKGLTDRSRRPHRSPRQLALRWQRALRRLRQAHPTWGPRKLRARLRQLHPRVHLADARTFGRWLKRLRLSVRPRRHQRRGPPLPMPKRIVARRANDVWTIDFKGWYRLGDGTRVEPLTVRDLKSRFILAIRLLPNQSDEMVRRALVEIFRRYGLPKAIRVDNGPPFGGCGPRGLSRLSVWWRRLGIQVEFGRKAHPQDNAAHEQMHGVYQAEVAAEPAWHLRAQQHRSDRWRKKYNQLRPHEALRLRPPAEHYHPSSRLWPSHLPPWEYPLAWFKKRVNPDGQLSWHGRHRFIGRPFAGEIIGLKPRPQGTWEIYLGRDLLGILHQSDTSKSLRPVQLTRS